MLQKNMTGTEKRATAGLSLIYAFRMLGLFMILPVFSIYAHQLENTTPFLIGLALGIYGLTQACLQIPFGVISDRIGRKPIITVGLLIFAIGSIIAANAHGIYGIILGRALQGAGAISSSTMALLADVTHEQHRIKAMATIGLSIGFSFAVAVIVGPIINQVLGLSGIFSLTAVMAFVGIIILFTMVPKTKKWTTHRDSEASFAQLPAIFANKELRRLNIGIFVQHALLTATFVVLPLLLKFAGLEQHAQWVMYLPVLVLAFAVSIPAIIIAEARKKMRRVFTACIFTLAFAELGFWLAQDSLAGMAIFMFLFFAAFCALEATLPSLVSKIAPAGSKGTAMGIYTTCQFLGIFFGGVMGGWIYQHYSMTDVLLMCMVMALAWFIIALRMAKPKYLSSFILPLNYPYPSKDQLTSIPGVVDAAVFSDEKVAYLKIDKDLIDESKLQSMMSAKNETQNLNPQVQPTQKPNQE